MYVSNTNTQIQYMQACTLNALEQVRALALEKALKYRFDPTISRVHGAYLNEINAIIEEYHERIG